MVPLYQFWERTRRFLGFIQFGHWILTHMVQNTRAFLDEHLQTRRQYGTSQSLKRVFNIQYCGMTQTLIEVVLTLCIRYLDSRRAKDFSGVREPQKYMSGRHGSSIQIKLQLDLKHADAMRYKNDDVHGIRRNKYSIA